MLHYSFILVLLLYEFNVNILYVNFLTLINCILLYVFETNYYEHKIILTIYQYMTKCDIKSFYTNSLLRFNSLFLFKMNVHTNIVRD